MQRRREHLNTRLACRMTERTLLGLIQRRHQNRSTTNSRRLSLHLVHVLSRHQTRRECTRELFIAG
jgi:hypothetical protein